MVLKKRKTGEEPESVAVEQPEEEILPSEEADLEEQTVLEQPIPEQATEQISEDQIPDHAEPTQEEVENEINKEFKAIS